MQHIKRLRKFFSFGLDIEKGRMEGFLHNFDLFIFLAWVVHLILKHECELDKVPKLYPQIANSWIVEVNSPHFVSFEHVAKVVVQESQSF